jgi:hypothetical protein
MVPKVQEDLLGDLFGRGVAAQDSPRQRVDGTTVAPVDLGERVLMPAADRHHQVGIARTGDIDHHGTVFEGKRESG